MSDINRLAKMAIMILQQHIGSLGYRPRIHFELEGGYRRADPRVEINYPAINVALKKHQILGSLKPEYWPNQWEYVSDFVGQTPLKEAQDFAAAVQLLPSLLMQHGAKSVEIRPILWQGDQGRLQSGCCNIFSLDTSAVHIPNAVQLNMSADKDGKNQIPLNGFGERLQQRLLDTSYQCCLLYLPEQEGFERLQLKSAYGLDAELSSPHELSGGHQGSIALYKDLGKHNQALGLTPLILDHQQRVLSTTQDWLSLSRIEHRLGAASLRYNPFVNVVFALCNLVETIIAVEQDQPIQAAPQHSLPKSLFGNNDTLGAFEIFDQGQWFSNAVNFNVAAVKDINEHFSDVPDDLGEQLKHTITAAYNRKLWVAD